MYKCAHERNYIILPCLKFLYYNCGNLHSPKQDDKPDVMFDGVIEKRLSFIDMIMEMGLSVSRYTVYFRSI
jgi:hypothetical protein